MFLNILLFNVLFLTNPSQKHNSVEQANPCIGHVISSQVIELLVEDELIMVGCQKSNRIEFPF